MTAHRSSTPPYSLVANRRSVAKPPSTYEPEGGIVTEPKESGDQLRALEAELADLDRRPWWPTRLLLALPVCQRALIEAYTDGYDDGRTDGAAL